MTVIKSVWVIGNKILITLLIDEKEISITLSVKELLRYAEKN